MIGYHSRFRHDDEDDDEVACRQTWEKEESKGMGGYAVAFMSEVYKQSGDRPCFDI
jgi:hypothetical protein